MRKLWTYSISVLWTLVNNQIICMFLVYEVVIEIQPTTYFPEEGSLMVGWTIWDMSRISTSINDVIKERCHTHIYKRTKGLKTNEGIFESKIICHECFFSFSVAGVTDSKAVKGSTSMLDWTDASSSTSSIVVIVTGIAAGIVFTILLVCLFVTCRRKVNTTMSRISFSVPNYC